MALLFVIVGEDDARTRVHVVGKVVGGSDAALQIDGSNSLGWTGKRQYHSRFAIGAQAFFI